MIGTESEYTLRYGGNPVETDLGKYPFALLDRILFGGLRIQLPDGTSTILDREKPITTYQSNGTKASLTLNGDTVLLRIYQLSETG